MTKNTKSVLIGIVIGAIVLAGGQYAWSKYQDGVKAKDLSVSMQGLKAATNKTAYLNSYFSSQPRPTKGVSVGLSNSSASEGGGYCSDLKDYIYGIYDYMENNCAKSYGQTSNSYLLDTSSENCSAASYYETLARVYWFEAGCSLEAN